MEQEYGIYEGFASVYDEFMDNIPYEEWSQYVHTLLQREKIQDGIVVELGCGTGTVTQKLQEYGYDMIGVDISTEMLEIAREKCDPKVLLLHQDMRELDLYGSAKAMVSICDSINYLLEEEDLEKTFSKVAAFLEKDGVFIFDMKTEYFYEKVLGNRVITDNREDASYIWENEYHKENRLNTYLLTTYELVNDREDLFVRSDELHHQRAYRVETVKNILEKQGFCQIQVYEALTQTEPKPDSQRVYYVAKVNK